MAEQGTDRFVASHLAVYEQQHGRIHVAHTGGCDLPADDAVKMAERIALALNTQADLLSACKWAKGQLRCIPHLDDPDCPACSGRNPLDRAIARATGGKE